MSRILFYNIPLYKIFLKVSLEFENLLKYNQEKYVPPPPPIKYNTMFISNNNNYSL